MMVSKFGISKLPGLGFQVNHVVKLSGCKGIKFFVPLKPPLGAPYRKPLASKALTATAAPRCCATCEILPTKTSRENPPTGKMESLLQRIHGTGMFTYYMVEFYGIDVGKYTHPIDPMV